MPPLVFDKFLDFGGLEGLRSPKIFLGDFEIFFAKKFFLVIFLKIFIRIHGHKDA